MNDNILSTSGKAFQKFISHLTEPPILIPTSTLLERVAYQINQIWTQPITIGKIG